MRSSLCHGERSLLKRRNEERVRAIVKRQGARFGVRMYEFAVVGNHLHVLVRITSQKLFSDFLRAVAGLIARAVLDVERGRARGIKFWDARPFTRIIEWGTAYALAKAYVRQNHLEAMGFASYRSRQSSA